MLRLAGHRPLQGRVRATSDKSISHRALMLGAMAEGQTLIHALNDGADVRSTIECLRALGVRIDDGDPVVVHGRAGELKCPTAALDCGNSGTTMRLLAGLLASQPFTATLDGDASLRARPMRRIAVPLRGLGVRVEGPDNGEHAPIIITGPVKRGGSFSSPVASAQIKSAAILAGAFGGKRVRIEEPGASRDHTELMLNAFGIECRFGEGYALVDPDEGQLLQGQELTVPADPSAVALLAACALVVPGSRIECEEVLLNPRRTGFIDVLRRMGNTPEVEEAGEQAGELIGRITFSPSPLRATKVRAEEIPSLIDEVPALAVLAALAEGTTVFEGVGELRHKESDRLEAMVELLAAFSIEARAGDSSLEVTGGQPRLRGDLVPTQDHRILMATASLLLAARAGGQQDLPAIDPSVAAVSDPRFFGLLEDLHGVDRD